MTTADVVVVGGGVVGCGIAWALAREQLSVVLLERDAIGAHASSVAAGMLTPFADVRGDEKALPLGPESLALFPAWTGELRECSGIDPLFVPSGVLRVATSDAEAAHQRARAARLAVHGGEWLDADAARMREPRLADGIRGALWSPDEGHVASELLTAACARAAQALGARIECGEPVLELLRTGDRVTGVRTPSGPWRAPWVVLATGPWAGSGPGLALPVFPVRGQIVSLRPSRPLLHAIAWDEQVYLVPRADGTVLAGATEERVGFDRRVTAEGVGRLVASAVRLLPDLADASFAGAAAGLRPGTPDGLPLVGPAPDVEGLFLAAGHGRNGILLSAITARLVADAIAGKALPPAARAFAPERFTGAAPGVAGRAPRG